MVKKLSNKININYQAFFVFDSTQTQKHARTQTHIVHYLVNKLAFQLTDFNWYNICGGLSLSRFVYIYQTAWGWLMADRQTDRQTDMTILKARKVCDRTYAKPFHSLRLVFLWKPFWL